MSKSELQKEVDKKAKERADINKEISVLSKKRQEYIDQKMKDENTDDDFGKAIENSILEFAHIKGFVIDN